MRKPTIKPFGENTYHLQSGEVSYYNIYACQWERKPASEITDKVLSTMTDVERQKIKRLSKNTAS